MTETLFNKRLRVHVKCKDCEERRANIRVSIELQLTTNPVHKRDLLVRLTDDTDPYFLYNLAISEEDFQSLKVQQGLLVDFASFPQKFIDLLNQCISEEDRDHPKFLLQLSSPSSPVLDHSPANLNVVETNAFKHLTHLSLKLLHGTDLELKKYLAVCLSTVKEEKQQLEKRLTKTEDDLSRQLSYAQQTLSEKSRELDKLRSEWTSQTSALSSSHSQDLTAEREKALETQTRLQQQNEQLRRELEGAHTKSTQQLQSRLGELEASNRDLTEKRYKSESIIRDLKTKLVGLEEESQRAKQQILSLRRENSTLDTECHERERQVNQLQTRLAVLEQEIKDKDQLVLRTKEVLEATQQQKNSVEGNAESKQLQIGKLEATVKCLSEELIKANGIIKKLQGELKGLAGKIKMKNTVTVSQEKVLQETQERLHTAQRDLQDTQQQLKHREEEVSKLKEQLEASIQKLDESREVLKTNENVIMWLNKQLNENQLSRKPEVIGTFETPSALSASLDSRAFPPSAGQGYPITSTGNSKLSSLPLSSRSVFSLHSQGPGPKAGSPPLPPAGLESKYFEKREDSIPLRGLLSGIQLNKAVPRPPPAKPGLQSLPSAYFPG
uniref:Spindle assembly abnormal protein 6 homolog n=1 Tax=Esox lucius TaxID=8010 RepID=A0AAY5K246_ESOLU